MSVALKVIAVVILLLGLVIAIVPQFTNCDYGTKMDTTATTMGGMESTTQTTMGGMESTTQTTMAMAKPATTKPVCFYTARAEIAVGAMLFVLGVFMLISSRKETWRALSVLAFLEGLFAILLPAALIGVCMMNTMVCRTSMEPLLYAAGGLTMALSLVALVGNEMRGRGGEGMEPTA